MEFNIIKIYIFINNNLNIFHRILNNWMFLAVTSIEMLIQFLIVQFGGLIFKCNKEGLTFSQWEWCLGLASITFVVNFILKFIKLEALCLFDWGKIFGRPNRNYGEEQVLEEEQDPKPQDTQKEKRIELEQY